MKWFELSNKPFYFHMFSASHFVILTIFLFISIVIFKYREKLTDDKWRKVELGVIFSLILIEITNHVWMYINGVWRIDHSMPLELCNIGLVLCVILVMTRKKLIFELLFFIALLGATQAIITPALTYDFPHFRFFHFFYTHMIVVWVTLYFTWAKGYFPTFTSVIKLLTFINLLLPLILFVNKKYGGNYWFLRHKPKSPSFFDVLGPYPWYIFSLESILIIFSLMVWLLVRNGEKNQGERSQTPLKEMNE